MPNIINDDDSDSKPYATSVFWPHFIQNTETNVKEAILLTQEDRLFVTLVAHCAPLAEHRSSDKKSRIQVRYYSTLSRAHLSDQPVLQNDYFI